MGGVAFVIDKFLVSEIFGPVFQGEGALAGMRTMFVRFGGCDSRCSWCDSMFSVEMRQSPEPWEQLSPAVIVQRLEAFAGSCRTVTFSGGNPALYDLTPLLLVLPTAWTVWVETQGTVFQPWLHSVNVTVSPKPPSAYAYDEARLQEFVRSFGSRIDATTSLVMKVPVDPDADGDFDFAVRMLYRFHPYIDEFTFSVVTHASDTTEQVIARWRAVEALVAAADLPVDPRVTPQLHVLAHGHKRGV